MAELDNLPLLVKFAFGGMLAVIFAVRYFGVVQGVGLFLGVTLDYSLVSVRPGFNCRMVQASRYGTYFRFAPNRRAVTTPGCGRGASWRCYPGGCVVAPPPDCHYAGKIGAAIKCWNDERS